MRGNESISSVEGGKRDRDLESLQTLYERRNLHAYLEQEAELAVQGEGAAQKTLSEAEAEMDIRNWDKEMLILSSMKPMRTRISEIGAVPVESMG